ncbi:hypothetical protein ACOMHN_023988 [Nucella lapillus]
MRQDVKEFANTYQYPDPSTPNALEQMWSDIKQMLSETVEKRVSSKTSAARHTNPWITTSIRRAIRRKQRAHKKARMTGKKKDVDRSALTKLLCGLYALMLVVFGVVFAIANSLTVKERQHLYYLEVFLLYLYLGSLATLLYFQFCILRGKQVRNAYLDNSIRVIIRRSQDNLQLSPCPSRKDNLPPPDRDFEEREVGLEPRKEPLDQMSTLSNASDFRSHLVLPPDGQVAHVGEGINFYLRLGALAFSIGSVTLDGFHIASYFETENTTTCESHIFILVYVSHLIFTFVQTFFLFKNHKLVIDKNKASVRFGLMHLLATNLCVWFVTAVTETSEDYRQQDYLDNRNVSNPPVLKSCYEDMTLARTASPYLFPCTIIYSIIATGVVYRMYTYVGIKVKQRWPSHTSLTSSAAPQVSHDVGIKVKQRWPSHTSLTSSAAPQVSAQPHLSHLFCRPAGECPATPLSPLLPPRSHTSLTSSAAPQVSHDVGIKVKQRWPSHTSLTSSAALQVSHDVGIKVKQRWPSHTSLTSSATPQGVVSMDCEKANKGLFSGLLIAVVTLIAIATFFVFDSRLNNPVTATKVFFMMEICCCNHTCCLPPTQVFFMMEICCCNHTCCLPPTQVFFVMEISLLVLTGGCIVVGNLRFVKLRFLENYLSLDSVLLLVSLAGAYVYLCFMLISSASTLQGYGVVSMLSLVTIAVGLVQSTLQAIFILDGLCRRAESDMQVENKPGRAVVTFVLVCNLALWVVTLFEIRKTIVVPFHRSFYGILPWNIILHLCVPLYIYFRFHSAICLSKIWFNAYQKGDRYA